MKTVMEEAMEKAVKASAGGRRQLERVWTAVRDYPKSRVGRVSVLSGVPRSNASSLLSQLIRRGMISFETVREPSGYPARLYSAVGTTYELRPIDPRFKDGLRARKKVPKAELASFAQATEKAASVAQQLAQAQVLSGSERASAALADAWAAEVPKPRQVKSVAEEVAAWPLGYACEVYAELSKVFAAKPVVHYNPYPSTTAPNA